MWRANVRDLFPRIKYRGSADETEEKQKQQRPELTVPMHASAVAAWLRNASRGSCGTTEDFVEGDCFNGDKGSHRLTDGQSASLEAAAAACLRLCALCERCRFVSVAPKYKDCSWFHTCPDSLATNVEGITSGARLSELTAAECSHRPDGQPQQQSAAATRQQSLATANAQPIGEISHRYAAWVQSLALPPETLEDGVVLTGDEGQTRALRRFLLKLIARQPVRIAAVGGSLTFGRGVTSREDSWPEQMRRSLAHVWNHTDIRLHNGAMPATQAGFGALCFHTLVPLKPDLVLVEYSHNTPESGKLELLLSTARQVAACSAPRACAPPPAPLPTATPRSPTAALPSRPRRCPGIGRDGIGVR